MMKKLMQLGVCIFMLAAGAAAQTVTGSGTSGTVPVFNGTSSVTNSPISVSGGNVGIGTTVAPTYPLEVSGSITSDVGAAGSQVRTYSYGNIPTLWIQASGTGNPNAQAWFRVNPGTYWAIGADYNNNSNFEIAGSSLDLGTNTRLAITTAGSVGIGTTNPLKKLHIAGDVEIDGQLFFGTNAQGQSGPYAGCTGADYAESVDVTGDRTKYEAGDVLVIDPKAPGKFLKSNEAYSTMAAGIYSTKPGFVGRLREANDPASKDEIPMAMLGRVPTKVTAENGPVQVGDLLVTSSTEGYAMKGTDRSRLTGAVIGKALGSLDSGTGTILVLITLQ